MARKILLVEDDPDARMGMTMRLRAWGFEVIQAGDGQSAITLVQNKRPDLVLLDLGLPAGDGFTVLQRLSHLGNASATPVIVLTARSSKADHERALSLGAVDLFVKPADNDLLLAAIRKHVPAETAPLGEHQSLKRVLLIEDDADTRAALRMRLQASGYVVSTAGDAATAMTRALHERPHVILLDLGLPAGDGFVVLERLRKNPTTASTPVVVLSARDAAANASKALAAGAVAYLQKPPDNDELLSVLARAVAAG